MCGVAYPQGKSGSVMSEPVTQSEVEDVLSSIRRLVGETRKSARAVSEQRKDEKLLLTPQQRIPDGDVLMLTPENAVRPDAGWQEYEEPPLTPPDSVSQLPEGQSSMRRTDGPTRSDVSALTAKIAALETAIAQTVDQWEPDGTGRDPYSGTPLPAMAWEENAELDGTGTPLSEGGAEPASISAETVSPPELSDDAQVIDEDTLRLLVAEIVRSELQGALGERITRNVRKLVRREIHRALIAQKLE